jgi:hypothetical protein
VGGAVRVGSVAVMSFEAFEEKNEEKKNMLALAPGCALGRSGVELCFFFIGLPLLSFVTMFPYG